MAEQYPLIPQTHSTLDGRVVHREFAVFRILHILVALHISVTHYLDMRYASQSIFS